MVVFRAAPMPARRAGSVVDPGGPAATREGRLPPAAGATPERPSVRALERALERP